MEIKVRGVDRIAIEAIDEKAKEFGLSRNTYLVRLIENDAVQDLLKDKQKELSEGYDRIVSLLEVLVNRMKVDSKEIQKVLMGLSIMSDVEFSVFDNILEGAIKDESTI